MLYGVTDFISNIGGLLGLCMGFSLLTAIEVVYWFLVRWGILRLKRKAEGKRGNRVQPMEEADDSVKANIKETQKQVFNHVFDPSDADGPKQQLAKR